MYVVCMTIVIGIMVYLHAPIWSIAIPTIAYIIALAELYRSIKQEQREEK